MTDLPAFTVGIVIAGIIAAITCLRFPDQRPQLLRTALAIWMNWIAGLLYVHTTGNMTPWHFNIFIDAVAAAGVMWHPAGKVQGYIGLFYFFQIAAHIAFGIRSLLGIPNDAIFYYDAITYVAWAQLIALGSWSGGIWITDILHRTRTGGHARDHSAGHFHLWGKK